jgi:hypothetical protein
MLIPLFSLALALVSPAAAQRAPVPSASRQAEISVMAADWTSYRNRAERMMAAFPAAVAREGGDRKSFEKLIADVRALCAQIVATEAETADIARETIRASEPPSAARLARENAARSLYEVRALTVYGNMLPRILDESTQDRAGRNDGRRFAGAEWSLAVDFAEAGAYGRALTERAGFTAEQYDAFNVRARASMGLPPAEK